MHEECVRGSVRGYVRVCSRDCSRESVEVTVLPHKTSIPVFVLGRQRQQNILRISEMTE